MNIVRRILGVLVIIAGILGLVLSLAGLVTVWVSKPKIFDYANTAINTINANAVAIKNVMEITGQVLDSTVDSVDALSTMLSTTAAALEDTMPILDEIEVLMAETLPSTLGAATDSLYTAQDAAQVLESTIRSLNAFRYLLSAAPLVGDFLGQPGESYNPEVPLAESLGDLAANLEGLPDTFTKMSANLNAADQNIGSIQENLITMSDSVGIISSSLGEVESMIIQSNSSMDNLTSILTDLQKNLNAILNWTGFVLSLFFGWLLVAQVVILTRGWELFQGTSEK